jgi:hypothetical protein
MKFPQGLVSGLQSLSLAILIGQVAEVGSTPLPPPQKAGKADATAELPQGPVKGYTDSYGNSVYLGIPFADTTGGQNRYVFNRLRVPPHPLLTIFAGGRLLRMSRNCSLVRHLMQPSMVLHVRKQSAGRRTRNRVRTV